MSDTTTPPPQFTSALGDPFDPAGASNLHQPGFLGVSPDVWRSLANFGGNLAAAANARTPGGFLQYGGGFGGPFGAAVSASQGQGMQRGVDLSHMALNRANAQSAQMDNYIKAMNLPLVQAQNELYIKALKDPQGFAASFGFNNPTLGSAPQQTDNAGSTNGGVPFAANNPLNMRYVGQQGAANTNGFAAFPTPEAGKAATDSLFDRYAQSGVNSLRGLISRWAPPSENNTDAYIAKVSKDTGLDPDQQIDLTNPIVKNVVQRSMAGFEGNKHANVPNAFQVAQAGNSPVPVPSQAAPQPVGNQGLVRYPNGNIGTPTASTQETPQQPSAQQGRQAPAAVQPDAAAMAKADQYEAQANQLEQAHLRYNNMVKQFPLVASVIPAPAGDPAALRQAAQQWRSYALAGATKGAEAAAAAPYNLQRVPPGGIVFNGNGEAVGAAPFQSHEVLSGGPNTGAEVTVLRDPRTNQIITGPSQGAGARGEGGQSANGLPPGAIQTKLPPQQQGRLKAQGEVEKEDLDHDRKTVEGDLEHVIDTVTPAKQQLFQLRSLVDSADTGAAGQFRSEFKNWVQTFAPDFVSKVTGDAAPAQEFDKIALMGAGKQERGDLGARGGFRAIEMYRNANPSMDKQPTANHDMANALLISHQYHEDYAQGAIDYYQKNRSSFLNPGAPGEYKPISNYDSSFIKAMRPELYAAAIGAINGKPYGEWAKGLSNKQMQIVGGIVQRADPSAVVDIQGHQVPVSSFKTVIGPSDIAGTGGPGAG